MQLLDQDRFEAARSEFDTSAYRSPGIDLYCSTTDWVLPAHLALMPPRSWLAARDEDLFFAGAIRTLEDGMRVLEPLEASWALASPIVGMTSERRAEKIVTWLQSFRQDWDVCLLAGLYRGSQPLSWLYHALEDRFTVRVGTNTDRYVADLRGGVDVYLSRRTANFRRSMRKVRARRERKGIEILAEPAASPGEADRVFERMLAVERSSWKGQSGVGIDQGAMRGFYELMGRRLAERERHRCSFAVRDGRDLAYIFGAVCGRHYRGLQFSFVQDAADLSLGNLMQLEEMHALVEEGVDTYDLGSEAPYKRRWCDRIETSPALFVFSGR